MNNFLKVLCDIKNNLLISIICTTKLRIATCVRDMCVYHSVLNYGKEN